MNAFREIVTSLCLATIATSIYKMLVPSGTFDKQLRLLISLFFVFAVITPFLERDINLTVPTVESLTASDSYESLEQSINEQLQLHTQQNLERELMRLLTAEDIEGAEIFASVNIFEDYSISINEIRLVLSDKGDSAQAERLVRGEVGEETTVVIETAEDE